MNWLRIKMEQINELTVGVFVLRFGKQLLFVLLGVLSIFGLLIFMLCQQPIAGGEQPSSAIGNESSIAEALALPAGDGGEAAAQTADQQSVMAQTAEGDSEPEQWYVDIKGAVKGPQIYPVDDEMRIHDVIVLAGGLTEEADATRLNFSQRVHDQMVIYVPKRNEEIPADIQSLTRQSAELPAEATAAASQVGSDEGQKININTADAQELQAISGVGEKKAADIIVYREANGPFQSVEDITLVSGIGDKTFEKMRAQITVQ